MNVKIVFCDLDFTLLDNNRNLPQTNIDTINKIDAQGAKFVVCTGRTKFRSKMIMEQLGFYGKKDQYIVNGNGSMISDGNYNPIYTFFYDNEVVIKVIDILIAKGITPVVCGIDEYLEINNLPPSDNKYNNTNCTYEDVLKRLDEGFDVLKIISRNANHETLLSCVPELNEKLGDELEISFSTETLLEINMKGINKGNAVVKLCEHLNIPLESALVIGDNLNDLSMYEISGVNKACPSNATDEIKKHADYVSINDNDNNAVSEILERYILNEK